MLDRIPLGSTVGPPALAAFAIVIVGMEPNPGKEDIGCDRETVLNKAGIEGEGEGAKATDR